MVKLKKFLAEGSRKIGGPFLRYKSTIKDILRRSDAMQTWKGTLNEKLELRKCTYLHKS